MINKMRFFEKTFLIANINSKIVVKIFIIILSIVNIDFIN